jgi:hypothetical protein
MPGNNRNNKPRATLSKNGSALIAGSLETYSNIDAAAMAAAQQVYSKANDSKANDGGWKLEYGMAIYGNKNGTSFCLDKIIDGKEQTVCYNGNCVTNHWVEMKDAMQKKIKGYIFKAFVHSHPASSPSICDYEFSTEDYYESIKGDNNGKPFNTYLVLNLGIRGMLMKFTPPTDDKLFVNKMRTFFDTREKVLLSNKDKLLEKIRLSKRNTTVNVVDKIVKECNGELVKTSMDGGHINWKPLSPKAILWGSGATTININPSPGAKRKATVSGESDIQNMSPERPSTYDLRETVTKVVIEEGVVEIGDEEFDGFVALTNIENQSSSLKIGNYAFSGCTNLTSIDIQSGNLDIMDNAFFGCNNLTSVDIQSGNLDIRNYAFSGCTNLTNVDILSRDIGKIGNKAFSSREKLARVKIHSMSNLKEIGTSAFSNCTNLTSVDIKSDSNIDEIGKYAFSKCLNLTSVAIESRSITKIGEYAFFNCTNLTSIAIRSRVLNKIAVNAFYACINLKNVICLSRVPPVVGNNAFYKVDSSACLYVPIGCRDAYLAANEWKKFKDIRELS